MSRVVLFLWVVLSGFLTLLAASEPTVLSFRRTVGPPINISMAPVVQFDFIGMFHVGEKHVHKIQRTSSRLDSMA